MSDTVTQAFRKLELKRALLWKTLFRYSLP